MSELKWIPVNEKLPEDCEDVIISFERHEEVDEDLLTELKTIHEKLHINHDIWLSENTKIIDKKLYFIHPHCILGVYFSGEPDEDGNSVKACFAVMSGLDGEIIDFPDDYKVVAWMPMPEPYEADEKSYVRIPTKHTDK